MLKKCGVYGVLIWLLIMSIMLTGCLGGGKDPIDERKNAEKEIQNLHKKHLELIEVDVEGYTALFQYPLELALGENEPFYVAEDAADLADLLVFGLGWPKYNGYKRVTRSELEIVLATDNKSASLEVEETWWHEEDDEAVGWGTEYYELQNVGGKWLFTNLSYDFTYWLNDFFEGGGSIEERKLAVAGIHAAFDEYEATFAQDNEAFAELFKYPLPVTFLEIGVGYSYGEAKDAEEFASLLPSEWNQMTFSFASVPEIYFDSAQKATVKVDTRRNFPSNDPTELRETYELQNVNDSWLFTRYPYIIVIRD